MAIGLDDFHRQVREKIEQDVPGYCQGKVGDHIVSLHPVAEGSNVTTMTTSSTYPSFREAKEALLDGTVRETCKASKGTFTKKDYESRADYYERGFLLADASDEDRAFAAEIREFAENIA